MADCAGGCSAGDRRQDGLGQPEENYGLDSTFISALDLNESMMNDYPHGDTNIVGCNSTMMGGNQSFFFMGGHHTLMYPSIEEQQRKMTFEEHDDCML